MTAVQTSLGAFTTAGWELVDEHPANPSGYGVDCLDCGQPMTYHYWPVADPAIETAVNGFGCERCQTVVPTQVTESDRRRDRLGIGGLRIAEATFRDGTTREIRVARGESDD